MFFDTILNQMMDETSFISSLQMKKKKFIGTTNVGVCHRSVVCVDLRNFFSNMIITCTFRKVNNITI